MREWLLVPRHRKPAATGEGPLLPGNISGGGLPTGLVFLSPASLSEAAALRQERRRNQYEHRMERDLVSCRET
jgi:hypothetical protein